MQYYHPNETASDPKAELFAVGTEVII